MTFARGAALAAFIACLGAGTPAFAQAETKAAAEALFQKAKALMAAQNYAEACPAFLESDRLDPGIGTKLRLADCYALTGKTASAWAQFVEAADAAAKAADPREKIARKKASELEPTLPRLIVRVVAVGADDVEIKRDGLPVGQATWGLPVPLDPGPHEITASAPDRRTWSAKVTAEPGRTVTLSVPALEANTKVVATAPPIRTEPAEPPREADHGSSWGPQRTAGVIVMGAGIVGLGLGAVFGLRAQSKLDASNEDGHCRADNRCDATGVELRDDFLQAATLSTIGFVAGGVLVVGGGVLYFTAPKGVTVTPSATARDGGLVVHGTF